MIEALSSLATTATRAAGDLSTALSGAVAPVSGGLLDFGQVLAQVSGDAVNTLKTGEATSIAGLQGTATVQDVVQAVMSAEQTLQTAIAIRDKVVAAYQEITRMAI
jgi:flagellar hook-basal body complex protein FliE